MQRHLGHGLLVEEVGRKTQVSLSIDRKHSVIFEVTDADGFGGIKGTLAADPNTRVEAFCNLEKGTGEIIIY